MSETQPWKPRLVALDVDGTVLDPATQSIADPVRAAVRAVAASGCHVVLATGRSMLGTRPVLTELGLSSGVALCSNGAVKMDAATGEALAVETFDPAPVHAKLAPRLPGALYAAEQVGTGSLVTAPFDQHQLHGPQEVTDEAQLLSAPVPRLIANWAGHRPDEVVAAVGGIDLPSVTCTIDHYEPWVTVVPAGVTKGAALEKLRTELGVAVEDTFAAGDGDNDVQMLEWAAHSVAMGQAPATVHAAAAESTHPVEQNGLVPALRRWFPEVPEER